MKENIFPQILSIGTSVPEFTIKQSDVKSFAAKFFADGFRGELDRLLPVFDNTNIDERHFSQPLEWFTKQHNFAEANCLYEKISLELALRAAEDAISKAKILAKEIGAVVFVSSTGIATPSIDSKIIQGLGLSPNTIRLPIWGLGCAGGVAGLARAAELSKVYSEKIILFVCVELCSITFQYNDHSKSNLVATSLFADGAAAVLIRSGCENNKINILSNFSTLFDNSEDIMGWDIIPTGLKVRFSRDIPTVIRELVPDEIKKASEFWNININDICHFALHPGGAKVIEAYYDTLGVDEKYLFFTREILRYYGNMSSPTVIFVLDEMQRNIPPSNDLGLMMALGPGFSAEQILFQW